MYSTCACISLLQHERNVAMQGLVVYVDTLLNKIHMLLESHSTSQTDAGPFRSL